MIPKRGGADFCNQWFGIQAIGHVTADVVDSLRSETLVDSEELWQVHGAVIVDCVGRQLTNESIQSQRIDLPIGVRDL